MGKFKVITISRQYGSGGHIIGENLAKRLEVPFYDKLLIDMIANESGMSTGYISDTENIETSSKIFNFAAMGYCPANTECTNNVTEDVFNAQSEIIQRVAKEPCIIVGRCADYILQDREDVLRIFIKASYEDRKNRAINDYNVDENEVSKIIKKSDKARAKYYAYYCEGDWGDANNYHLAIDSGIGIDKAVNIILEAIK
ncbi:MAG: cytidylate kinase-like family protein [Eubacteriales bacterium]|nr:cytidylate kinase-like family protein [Eubacteriales bacterium]MDY3332616.1 cytidylate kinase-like family protein [Gallibacter sp.]